MKPPSSREKTQMLRSNGVSEGRLVVASGAGSELAMTRRRLLATVPRLEEVGCLAHVSALG